MAFPAQVTSFSAQVTSSQHHLIAIVGALSNESKTTEPVPWHGKQPYALDRWTERWGMVVDTVVNEGMRVGRRVAAGDKNSTRPLVFTSGF